MKEQVILIRFGEIFLKGNNKKHFEMLLKKNIKYALRDLKCTLTFSQNRYFIENYDTECEAELVDRLLKIFGIYSISPCAKVLNTVEDVFEASKKYLRDSGTFRFTVNRADKTFPMNSMQFARELGGMALDLHPNLTVELFTPDVEIKVDMRENGYSYVFADTLLGVGGLPVGSAGGGLLLLSGGIDSPVAGYMMAKRGVKLTALHFHSEPYTNALARDKVYRLRDKVSEYSGDIRLLVVPVTEIQRSIHEKCPEEYMITMLRRFMMRIALRLARQYDLGVIITGESLGQVASQTMESMTVTNVLVDIPVLRPLVGFDKEEIIAIAKRIGTFATSIEPHQDCCTVFLPKSPSIHPKLHTVEKFESALDIDTLVDNALAGLEIVDR